MANNNKIVFGLAILLSIAVLITGVWMCYSPFMIVQVVAYVWTVLAAVWAVLVAIKTSQDQIEIAKQEWLHIFHMKKCTVQYEKVLRVWLQYFI